MPQQQTSSQQFVVCISIDGDKKIKQVLITLMSSQTKNNYQFLFKTPIFVCNLSNSKQWFLYRMIIITMYSLKWKVSWNARFERFKWTWTTWWYFWYCLRLILMGWSAFLSFTFTTNVWLQSYYRVITVILWSNESHQVMTLVTWVVMCHAGARSQVPGM